ncbi:MAG TPA: heme-binding protein [Solirubrobacteraceae bacterium]|nr:heme-binding protein [Solirubrobacteraceae bacterium]
MKLQLDAARELIALAQEKAAQYGKAITVAVVDAGGFLIALDRQDGGRPLTPSIAISKAYTAAVMQRPANMLKGWSDSEPTFFSQVSRMGMHPIVAADGGVTVVRGGEIIGGIGVSGGRPEEDQAICEAALTEAGYELEFAAWGAKR